MGGEVREQQRFRSRCDAWACEARVLIVQRILRPLFTAWLNGLNYIYGGVREGDVVAGDEGGGPDTRARSFFRRASTAFDWFF